MKAAVQLINQRGSAIPARQRAAMPVYKGVLHIREARVPALGRIVATAELYSSTESVKQPLIPMLMDADVLFLRDTQMRIRGFEYVDGIQYGQTWDIKVL
jgi:hypothetical protein